jgi:NTP pyrophosphatase (non-canonical NTP hydrolase)
MTGNNWGAIKRRPAVTEIEELQQRLRAFAECRDWTQFHSPKNLSMALMAEVGELAEHFQWLTQEESFGLDANKLQAVGEELADICVYLVRLADQLGLDLAAAVERKLVLNEEKYPADRVRGSARKYSDY